MRRFGVISALLLSLFYSGYSKNTIIAVKSSCHLRHELIFDNFKPVDNRDGKLYLYLGRVFLDKEAYNIVTDIPFIFRGIPTTFIKNNDHFYGFEWSLNTSTYKTVYIFKRKATKIDDLVYNKKNCYWLNLIINFYE